jgi:purine catabolism regulator
MFTVKQFLKLQQFRDFKLIAGDGGLDNVISSVNIMDNPDALDWFTPGDMLLTSGYFFKDSSKIQNDVVNQLKIINCPALCIKPKRYFGTIPANIIELANELNIPVIEIPYGVSFSKIISIVMEEITEKYDVLNRKSLDIHEAFFNISLYGGGLEKICSSLSVMLKNPVVLLDKYWNIFQWSELVGNPKPIGNYLHLEINAPFIDSGLIQTLPVDFENLQKPVVRQIKVDNQLIDCVIMPVFITNAHHGYILVWKTMNDLSEVDFIALEHGAMSFALERIRLLELEKTKNKIRKDFYEELLSGNVKTRENLEYLCELHGLNPNLWYTPALAHIDFYGIEGSDLIEKKRIEEYKFKDILKFLDEYAHEKKYALHCFSQNNQIVILLGMKSDISLTNSFTVHETLNDIIIDLEKFVDGISMRLGVGRICKNLLNISKTYNEARESLRLLRKSKSGIKISRYEDFVVHHFLEENISTHAMKKFFEEALGPIYEYDQKYHSELLPTLEAWISHHMNVAETSRALFTHRNTILYRIDRIASILQTDLKNSDELLKFQLAIKIYRLLDL